MRGTTIRHGQGRLPMRLATLVLITAAVVGCSGEVQGPGAGGSGGEAGGQGGGSTTTTGGGGAATTTAQGGGGAGGCTPVDDGNACTQDLCDGNGMPASVPSPEGTPCDEGGGKVCDGLGQCLECVTSGDCGDLEECFQGTCLVAEYCIDNVQNGDETDVDCGGSCPPCADGQGCVGGSDCQSGVCGGATCSAPICGDGLVNQPTEICDDGNQIDGDGCNHLCLFGECGDGLQEGTEACDEGNFTNGDGCDDGPGGNCTITACGNGVITSGEACDDGNTIDGDGCNADCTL